MTYVNNWIRAITLTAGQTSHALDLPDGQYRLTVADSPSAAIRWEIIDAVVAGGAATLTRAREGTADQDWLEGSVIYNAATAGGLNDMLQRLSKLEAGEGGSVIIADSPPGEGDIPAAPGGLYIAPGGAWVAMGVAQGSDWARIVGAYGDFTYTYPITTPGHSYAAQYDQRNFRIELDGTYSGTYPATLVFPWTGIPYNLEIFILPAGADSIALSLDCSSVGEQSYPRIENRGVASAALSSVGAVITITAAEPCHLRLLSGWQEAAEFGLDFLLEPVITPTFMTAPE